MGGNLRTISAKNKTELKERVQEWVREAKAVGLTDIRRGYDPERVVKTEKGYKIQVWAHS